MTLWDPGDTHLKYAHGMLIKMKVAAHTFKLPTNRWSGREPGSSGYGRRLLF